MLTAKERKPTRAARALASGTPNRLLSYVGAPLPAMEGHDPATWHVPAVLAATALAFTVCIVSVELARAYRSRA